MATSYESLNPSARKYYKKMESAYRDALGKRSSSTSDPYAAGRIASQAQAAIGPDTATPEKKSNDPTNPGTWILDILSQPGYALTEQLSDLGGALSSDLHGRTNMALPKELLLGLSNNKNFGFGKGNEKATGAEIVSGNKDFYNRMSEKAGGSPTEYKADLGPFAANKSDNGLQKFGKGALAFGGAVATDPLSYISMGGVGAAVQGAGKLAKGAISAEKIAEGSKLANAAVKAADAVETTGKVVSKVDKAITKVQDKAIRGTFNVAGKAARATKDALTPAATKAARQLAEDKAAALSEAVLGSAAKEEARKSLLEALTAKNADITSPRTIDRMLKDTVTGETVPFSAALARKKVVPDVTEALDKIKTPEGKLPTPFMKESIPKSNVKVSPTEGDSLLSDLVKPQTLTEEASATAADATKVAVTPKPKQVDVLEWVTKNADTPITVPIPYGKAVTRPTTKSAQEWMDKLTSTIAPVSSASKSAIQREVLRAAQAGAAADTAAVAGRDVAAEARARAVAAAATGDPTITHGRVPSPSEAVQRASEPGVAGRSWTTKTPGARNKIRDAYKQALSAEHFDYLYAEVGRRDLTAAQKQAVFTNKLAAIAKGKALNIPRYTEFYRMQIVEGARDISERLASPISLSPKSQAANELLSTIRTGTELMADVDTSLAATASRDEIRTYSGEKLSENAKSAIKTVMSEGYIRPDGVPSAGWKKVPESLTERTDIQGTLRDSKVPGVGHGVNKNAYNGHKQATILVNLIRKHAEEIKDSGLTGLTRANRMYESVMKDMRDIETYFRAHGVEPIAGNASKGIPLSTADLLEALSTTRAGKNFVLGRIFDSAGISAIGSHGIKGTVYVNKLMDIASVVVDNMDASAINAARGGVDVLSTIAHQVASYIKSGKVPDSEGVLKMLTEDGKFPISVGRKIDGLKQVDALDSAGKVVSTSWQVSDTHAKGVAEELYNVLFNAVEYGKPDFRVLNALVQTIQARSASYEIKFGDNVRQLLDSSMTDVLDFLDSASGVKEVADKLGDTQAIVNAVSKTKRIQPSSAEKLEATLKLQEDLSDVVSIWDMKQVKALKNISAAERAVAGGSRSEINKAMNQAFEDVKDELFDGPSKNAAEISIMDVAEIDASAAKRRSPLGVIEHLFAPSKIIDETGKMVDSRLHQTFLNSGSLSRDLSKWVRSSLTDTQRLASKVAKELGTTDSRSLIAEAYRHIQRGEVGQVTEHTKQLAAELTKVSSMFFDKASNARLGEGTPGILQDFFNRGYDLKHVQDKMSAEMFGIPAKWQFDWDAVASKVTADEKVAELHSQWTKMDIDDPIDYLARLDKTIGSLSMDVSVSQSAWSKMRKLDLVSTTPRPGYVKLSNTEQNLISRYFPAKEGSYFVEKRVIPELQKMDYLLSAPTKAAGDMASLVRLYDASLNMWKAGMTVWNPNHHMRNLVGDMSLSFLADGVKNPRHYKNAIKLLSERKQYDGVDMLRMLQGVDDLGRDAAGKFSLKVSLGNGKHLTLDSGDLYEALYRHGVIKDFSQQEDLIENILTPKSIQQFQSAIQLKGAARGKMKEAVGGLSEARDDFVRLAHALHLMENKGILTQKSKVYNSLDDLIEDVAHRVNQVHPDGTDLSPFERKYMKRVIPFYSWMRKSIPLIIESAVMHPGRITMYPKFSYAMANQMGVDPDSMSDPFPADQMFPSWITNQTTGPIMQNDKSGNYYGISPGIVDADFLDQWIAGGPTGAKNNLLDMISPIIKTPFELQSGKTLGQGISSPGKDPVEYLGTQIPGISQTQRLSGIDPIGSIGTLVQGKGIDPIQSVQKGNREQFDPTKLLNYFLGIQSQNYSTPSIVNAAEIEARNRAKGAN